MSRPHRFAASGRFDCHTRSSGFGGSRGGAKHFSGIIARLRSPGARRLGPYGQASPKPLRSAGPAMQSGELDPLRVGTHVAGAFAGNRDPGELVVATRSASAPFSSGSAGGPPTVCPLSPSGNRHRSPTRGPIQGAGSGRRRTRSGEVEPQISCPLFALALVAPVQLPAPRVGPVVPRNPSGCHGFSFL